MEDNEIPVNAQHEQKETVFTPSIGTTPQQSQPSETVLPYRFNQSPFWQWFTAPSVIGLGAILIMVAMLSFGLGAQSATASNGDNGMNMSTSSAPNTANVTDAVEDHGNQLASYTVENGIKQFTFKAYQVMWEPVRGKRVLADTINGMVPGPMIRVTAGDHVRITLTNRLPQSTSLHWHGLQLPSSVDGVPGIGQDPIQPGQTYTYDFTVHDEDVGTHWYHSHNNDADQVPRGLYGAFIVDPHPGSPQAQNEVHADIDYTAMISELGDYYVINGKSFPDTQPLIVKHGQTVRLRLIGANEMMHPMHLHGHTFSIVAEDGHMLAQPIEKDTVQVASGETYDLTFKAWAAPGSIYPFHCHILSHLMNPGQSSGEMGGLIMLIQYAKA